MPLFWNNNFNQAQNFQKNNIQNNFPIRNNGSLFSRLILNRQNYNLGQMQNNMPSNIQGIPMQNGLFNNNMINQNNQAFMQPNQQMQPVYHNPSINQPQMVQDNSGISFKPLTDEEMSKINEEIQENIEKNRKQIFPINEQKDKEQFSLYLKEFIQDEKNGNIFYNSLANNCNNDYYKNKLKMIGEECNIETNSLRKYYKALQNEDFEPENLEINTNIPLKQGLLLAIEEEIKSYDKICNVLSKLPFDDTKEFYKMAFKKLSRINSIQYMAMEKSL